jgi:hypothetical protein
MRSAGKSFGGDADNFSLRFGNFQMVEVVFDKSTRLAGFVDKGREACTS